MIALRRWLPIAIAFAVISGVSTPGHAQQYPNRPIRLIVPYDAAGTLDVVGRALGAKLAESLGQPVVVENIPGANGIVGTTAGKRAANDGYTLLLVAANHVINASLYQQLPYDVIKDFTPVSIVGSTRSVLCVHPSIPATSVSELIAYVKDRPGKLNYASTGVGSPPHLNAEQFMTLAKLDVVHVPYKGAAPLAAGLVSGDVAMAFVPITIAIPQNKAGRMRCLGVPGARRSPALPDLPTITEGGLPGMVMLPWMAIIAPAGTPRDIVVLLNGEIAKAVKDRDLLNRLLPQGAEIYGGTPEELGSMMQSDLVNWAEVVKRSGAKLE